MDAELQARVEEILAGANRTSSMFAGDERLDTILQANLNSVGLDLAGQLDVGEGVLATAPALVAWAGKSDPGLVIVTARRVLLAWTSGMRSQQVHLRSAAAGGEAEVTKHLEKFGTLLGWGTRITVSGDPALSFAVRDTKAGYVGNFVHDCILGGFKLDTDHPGTKAPTSSPQRSATVPAEPEAATDTAYNSDGICRTCGKAVPAGNRALHLRYCSTVGFCGGCGEPLSGSFCGACGRPADPDTARHDQPAPEVEQPALETVVVREQPTVALPVPQPAPTPTAPPRTPALSPAQAAWPLPGAPSPPGPPAVATRPPRRGSAAPTAALVGALLVVGLGAGAVGWQQGWLPGMADPTAVATATVTASATVLTQQPTEELPSAEPTPTEQTPEELRAEALSTLEQIVEDDRGMSPVRGQWVAQLASKSEGIIDTTQQPDPFTLPDILAEVRSHQANSEYGSRVLVVHQGDWGQTEAGPDPMWVTFADINMSSQEEVVSWCEDHFSQRGKALLNVCYPRQMKLK